MPIYAYICLECGLKSEALRKMSESSSPYECPDCSSMNTKKAVTAPAIHLAVDGQNFRGSGKADFDKMVGASAEKKWDDINQKQAKRDAVRKSTGADALTRTPDGGYAPASQGNLDRRTTAYKKFAFAKKTGTRIDHDS
jgi:putative FmdB family regulatory protein